MLARFIEAVLSNYSPPFSNFQSTWPVPPTLFFSLNKSSVCVIHNKVHRLTAGVYSRDFKVQSRSLSPMLVALFDWLEPSIGYDFVNVNIISYLIFTILYNRPETIQDHSTLGPWVCYDSENHVGLNPQPSSPPTREVH